MMMTLANLTLKSATLLGFLFVAAPMAMAEGSDADAATQAKITAEMTAEGYDVRKMQVEDGVLEVYAVKDGKTFQVFYDKNLVLIKTCDDAGCSDGSTAEGGEGGNG
jgi:hypothetical protein